MKFKAAILENIKKPLVIDEIENDSLSEGQVLVKILQTGACRSQIFEMEGQRGIDKYLPHLLGHEAIGIVIDLGKNVTKVNEGDYVVLSWIKSKGISGYHRVSKRLKLNSRIHNFPINLQLKIPKLTYIW